MDGTYLKQSIKHTSSCAQDHLKCVKVLTLKGLFSSSLLNLFCINDILRVSVCVRAYMCAVGHIAMHRLFYSTAMKPYKYAGYPMLIKTIELETNDDELFSKSAPLLTAASELAFHTINTSILNAEELRREGGIAVSVVNYCLRAKKYPEAITQAFLLTYTKIFYFTFFVNPQVTSYAFQSNYTFDTLF